MKNINELINELPKDARARVNARAEQLIGEEMALQHLRKARQLTQTVIAKTLGIGQDGVSRLEKRNDILMSTLESYVEAMGGKLRLVVEFPDGVATLSSSLLSAATEQAHRSSVKETRRSVRGTYRSLASDQNKIRKAAQKRKPRLAHVND